MGPLIQERAQLLIGVDLSRAMLGKAAEREAYDRLEQADVERYLERDGPRFDAILAADVLVYLGDLERVFEGAAKRLAPGGLFVFTTERGEGDDYQLERAGRFAHARGYLEDLARRHGFIDVSIEDVRVRDEAYAPSPGLLFRAVRGEV